MKKAILTALVILGIGGSLPLQAQCPISIIEGTATDVTDWTYMEGVKVEVIGYDLLTVYTDMSGAYTISLCAGAYYLRFSKAGYQNVTVYADVSAPGVYTRSAFMNPEDWGRLALNTRTNYPFLGTENVRHSCSAQKLRLDSTGSVSGILV